MTHRGKVSQRSILPIFVLNWMFGMGIIEFPVGRVRKIISIFYTALWFMFYGSLAAYAYPYIIQMTREFEANQNMIRVLFSFHILLAITTIFSGWFRNQGMHSILHYAECADELLEKMGGAEKSTKLFRINLCKYIKSLIFILAVMTANILITIFNDKHVRLQQIIALFVINHPIVIMFIVDSTFINVVEYARHRFINLNNLLNSMLTCTIECPQHIKIIKRHFTSDESSNGKMDNNIIVENPVTVVQTAKMTHAALAKVCQIADETFGLHNLISIVTSIIVITASLYHIYVLVLYTHIPKTDLYRILTSTATWLVYFSIKSYIISSCCSATVEESKVSGDIISKIYDEDYVNYEAQLQIKGFYYQLIESSIAFKAHGFFTIDFTMIHGIIGSVTTYLMILSQFGNFMTPLCRNANCT